MSADYRCRPSHHIDDITELLLVFVSVSGGQGPVSWEGERRRQNWRRRGGDRLGGDNDDNNERVVEEGRVGDLRDSGDQDENKDENNDLGDEERVTQSGVGHE